MTLSLEAGVLPGLPEMRSYVRSVQVGQLLQGDVPHALAGARQHSGGIIQFRPKRECETDVSSKDADVADAVLDDAFRCAVQEHHLRSHFENVLMTRGHLFMDDRPKTKRKGLDGGVVPIEKVEQLARRSGHTTQSERDAGRLMRFAAARSWMVSVPP